jgi:PAS domain S-box-containing protein
VTRAFVSAPPSRVDASRRGTNASRSKREPPPPERDETPWFKTTASLLGTVGLVLLVVLAFTLSSNLKTALEEEIALRLRASAKYVLLAMSEIEAPRFADPNLIARLDEIRSLIPVTAIAVYDSRGRPIAYSSEPGAAAAWPREIHIVRRSGIEDVDARDAKLDGAGGWSLLAYGPAGSWCGAALVRLDSTHLQALGTVRTLFQLGKILAGLVILTGVLVLLRWARPSAPALPSMRASVDPSSDVDLVLGTMQQVVHSLKDSETDYRDRWTAAARDADHFRTTSASIVESISSGIVAFDAAGKITLSNRAAESILEFDGRNAAGKMLADVFGAGDPVTKLAGDLLERGGVAARQEISRLDARGDTCWIGVSSSILHRAGGVPAGGILLVTDLTEARRSAEEAKLKDRLSAVGEMSAGIAHEIKNSLHSIMGFANLLREDAKDAEPPLAVRGILAEMHSLDATVRRILEFAKPSSFSYERTSVNRLVEEAAAAIAEKGKAQRVELILELAAGLPDARLDAVSIRGAFVNLAGNAIEAMVDGGTLTISTRAADSSKEIRISFRDTGPGIPEEDRAKVFTPFFSTKRSGVGLGLALTQKTISDHGGRIQLHSRSGVGTEFVVHLPAGLYS